MAVHLMIYDRIKVYVWTTYGLPYIILYVLFFLVVKMKILKVKPKGAIENDKED
jgi:hypothetical protein